jgi:hypothetical protein
MEIGPKNRREIRTNMRNFSLLNIGANPMPYKEKDGTKNFPVRKTEKVFIDLRDHCFSIQTNDLWDHTKLGPFLDNKNATPQKTWKTNLRSKTQRKGWEPGVPTVNLASAMGCHQDQDI